MKKILLNALLILGLSSFVIAQNFSLETDTMFLNIDLNSDIEYTVDIYNDLPEDAVLLTWEISNLDVPGNWGVRICDNKACYDNEAGSIPGVATMNPIVAGASAFIKLKVKPYDNAYYGKIEFFLYEEGDQDNGQLLVFIINAGGLSVENQIIEPTNVFPNPVQNDLFISFNSSEINYIKLVDTQGRVVLEEQVFGSMEKLDLNRFSNGTYLVQTFSINNELLETIPVIKN